MVFGAIARAFTSLKTKVSALFSSWGVKDHSSLLVGLDAAGKTTLLYKLRLGEVVSTIPTIGFNVEELQYKKLRMQVWDVGGQDKIRPLWRHYCKNLNSLVFAVDSADRERLDEARDELHKVLALNEPSLPVLIYANKQDMATAVSPAVVANALGLASLPNPWHVQGCSSLSGDGLYEGLGWLHDQTA